MRDAAQRRAREELAAGAGLGDVGDDERAGGATGVFARYRALVGPASEGLRA